MIKTRSFVERSILSGERIFCLEKYIESGKLTTISPKLREYIQSMVAVGWRRGYSAGKRGSK